MGSPTGLISTAGTNPFLVPIELVPPLSSTAGWTVQKDTMVMPEELDELLMNDVMTMPGKLDELLMSDTMVMPGELDELLMNNVMAMQKDAMAMLGQLDELLMNDAMVMTEELDEPLMDDTMATPGELDELLMGLWDSDKEQALGFSSCSAPKEASAISSQYDDHSYLSSILPMVPAASSMSHGIVDPRTSGTGGATAQQHHQTIRANSSSKRSAPEGAEGGESSKRSRKAPCSTAGGDEMVRSYTFGMVKPCSSVTLADINRRILTPPAGPVRHPVGEFACAPGVSAGNWPAPSASGKAVAGFTKLRTAGGGTITIVMLNHDAQG